jgi:predicted chitinase/peptidoglycan hydrolase-like protein with peptidoglycan-binding domain
MLPRIGPAPVVSAPTAPSARTIREAEALLKKAGFHPGTVDGRSSPALEAALREFQGAWSLPTTGQLDAATLSKLRGTAKRIAAHAKAKDGHLSVGQKGRAILDVEKRLRALGYAPGKVDGVFGRDTAEAVKAFRADQKELKDGSGSLSRASRKVLQKEAADLAHAPYRARRAPTKAQARLDTLTASAAVARHADGSVGIGLGSKSPAVKNVQAHLAAAGFSPKHGTGTFDERTEGALKAFQRRAGLEATGRVDATTWKALKKSLILSKRPAAPAQALWERSAAVKRTEKLLKQLGFNPGRIDGLFDTRTRKAVKAFEKREHLKVDGVVGTNELAKMKKLTKGVSLGQLHRIMPSLPMSKARRYLPLLNRAMAEAHINTKQRKAMFLAQLAHESVELRYFEEIASGAEYEGRTDLGNTHPGDGVRYKGRGPIQLTGRSNYRAAGHALGLPLEAHPTMAARPSVGFRTAGWFWTSRGLNAYADRGDFRGVTLRINGGYNGLDSRLRYYHRALQVL